MRVITPLLLCGGSGTRLWPLSRRSYPKQFVALTGRDTLFQQAALRLSGPGFAPPVIVTASDFRFVVAEQLAQAGVAPRAILIEPAARNTAPAILAGALQAAEADPDALILAAPTDHEVPDAAAFRAAVEAGRAAAEAGAIVTFGIAPTRPETGYGWLRLSESSGEGAALPLDAFVEKPDAARAAALLADGRHLWNAGIFLMSARTLVEAFRRLAPETLAAVEAAVAGARADLDFVRLAPEPWAQAPDISIDHAIMERAGPGALRVVPFAAGWSDLGDWEAVRHALPQDAQGNAIQGAVTAIDCSDSLLRSEAEGVRLVGLGLSGLAVVATADAVLVADRARAQEVKAVVARLRADGARQADTFLRDYRPWGWFETLALAERFQVKRIVVHPGRALSLQSHLHRSEHWIVVSGTAKVTVDDRVQLVSENQSIYVPLGARHRLENPGKVDMVLIEVQTGTYLGEDDITRHEDLYRRP